MRALPTTSVDVAEAAPAMPRRRVFDASRRAQLAAAPTAPYHALVLEHCLGEGGALALLAAADRWLVADTPATLEITDEFLLDPQPGDAPGKVVLASLRALAVRMGWQLQQEAELARQGRCVRQRLVFRRHAAPADRLHPMVGDADSVAMRALFEQVFGQPMTAEHWHWKYAQGRGLGVGLSRNGRLLAHYGGTRRRVLWNGKPALAAQPCDVMVAPEANSALVRKGPMHQVSATFLETELGWGGRQPLAFGFPSDRHHVLARRLHLYDAVDSIERAFWPAAGAEAGPRWQVQALAEADLVPGAGAARTVDRLWQRMAASFASQVIGVRDAAWLRQRYALHPLHRYELLLLRGRFTRRALGLVVLRRQADHLMVLDLLAPPRHFGALLLQARRHAQAHGLPRVDCWITASQLPLLAGIAPEAFGHQPMNITVPANIHTPGPVDEVRGRWFLLAGDADFT